MRYLNMLSKTTCNSDLYAINTTQLQSISRFRTT